MDKFDQAISSLKCHQEEGCGGETQERKEEKKVSLRYLRKWMAGEWKKTGALSSEKAWDYFVKKVQKHDKTQSNVQSDALEKKINAIVKWMPLVVGGGVLGLFLAMVLLKGATLGVVGVFMEVMILFSILFYDFPWVSQKRRDKPSKKAENLSLIVLGLASSSQDKKEVYNSLLKLYQKDNHNAYFWRDIRLAHTYYLSTLKQAPQLDGLEIEEEATQTICIIKGQEIEAQNDDGRKTNSFHF